VNEIKVLWAGLLCAGLCGCDWLEDNGVYMAYCLKEGARELAHPTNTELIVRYEPLDGIHQVDDGEFNPDSVLLIGGKREGTTTYHLNYAHVGRRFALMKTNEATLVTLRNVGDWIDMVDVR
jgi:hypothetical protein